MYSTNCKYDRAIKLVANYACFSASVMDAMWGLFITTTDRIEDTLKLCSPRNQQLPIHHHYLLIQVEGCKRGSSKTSSVCCGAMRHLPIFKRNATRHGIARPSCLCKKVCACVLVRWNSHMMFQNSLWSGTWWFRSALKRCVGVCLFRFMPNNTYEYIDGSWLQCSLTCFWKLGIRVVSIGLNII